MFIAFCMFWAYYYSKFYFWDKKITIITFIFLGSFFFINFYYIFIYKYFGSIIKLL